MNTTNRISVVLATLGLLVVAGLVFGGAWFELIPTQCRDIRKIADREDVVERLRLDLTEFVNSFEGRDALLGMSGQTQRRERLPRTFDAVVSNLEINTDRVLLVQEFDRIGRRGAEPNTITAIGIGYTRARLLYSITNQAEIHGRIDPIELSKDSYVVCDDD